MGIHVIPLCTNHLVGCLLLLLLQIAFPCNGKAGNCRKLLFWSSHGCQPCSLCDPKTAEGLNLVRQECRQGNPDPFADGRVLWCDVSSGPFPECPHIHKSVLQSPCSESCSANFRRFAPGCMCTVGCTGQPSQTVVCTEELHWNSSDIPGECVSVSPSLSTMAPEEDGNETLAVTIALGSIVVVILLGLVFMIIGTCFYKRLRSRFSPPPSSGVQVLNCVAPLLNGRAGSHYAPSEDRTQMSAPGQEADQTRRDHDEGSADGSVVIPVEGEGAGELPNGAVADPRTERDGVQQREACTEEGRRQRESSVAALKALLNSRQALVEVSRLFDQRYAFDKVTWHDLALHLLDWDHHDLHHTEYQCVAVSDSPGDGPMYKVLEAARQEGKGLLDLIHCLRQQRKKQGGDGSKKTEEVLVNFWQNWNLKQAAEQAC